MADGAKPRLRPPPTARRPDRPPAWAVTTLRVSREGKARFEEFRYFVSRPDRIVPHWEAFEMLLDLAQPFARIVERDGADASARI